MKSRAFLFPLSLLGISVSQAETFIVNNADDDGPGSLRSAIAAANLTTEADLIRFSDGADGGIDFTTESAPAILLESTLSVTEPLSIQGPAEQPLTIDGQNSIRVFTMSGSDPANPHRLENLMIQNGRSTRGGANVRVFGSLEINSCTIRGGQANALNGNGNNSQNADGGGLFHSGGQLTIEASVFSGNSTIGGFSQGGGLYTESGTAIIRNSRITNNTTNGAVAEGGGIGSRSILLLENCEISENETLNRSSGGGGIYADATTTIRQCTLSQNVVGANTGISGYSVGGAFANVRGDAIFEHCTITENSAPTGMGQGAGISSISTGTLSFFNCIVSGNGSSDLDETPNRALNYRDDGFNLFGVVTNTNLNNPNNRQDSSSYGVSDPQLSALGFYGGITRCHIPLTGSPAIDQGAYPLNLTTPLLTDYDQRGVDFPRSIGTRLDRGSSERQTLIDENENELPDAIEALIPNFSSDTNDQDQDGAEDTQEYQLLGIEAISDPMLRPRLRISAGITDGQWRLSFPSSLNREYRLLTNNDLSSTPTPVNESYQNFSHSSSFLDAPDDGPLAFYYLEVRIPAEPSE